MALQTQSRHTNHKLDLDDAISLLQEVVEIHPKSGPSYLESILNLAVALVTRFGKTSQPQDLLELIQYCYILEDADMRLDEEARQLFSSVSNLSLEFDQLGQITDLETAISLFRECLRMLPIHHPNHLVTSCGLTNALMTWFNALGQHKDLDVVLSLN